MDFAVTPRGVKRKMEKPLVLGMSWICTRADGHRFDALSFTVTEDFFCVERERFAPDLAAQYPSDAIGIL
jgi:hypothetical protein